MLTSIDLKSNSWTAADYIVDIDMRKYCEDDAKITMKLLKNRYYGAVMQPVRNITHVSGPHLVDGAPWYQVDLGRDAANWLRDLNHFAVKEVEGCFNCFDMPEDIYILTKLKWA